MNDFSKNLVKEYKYWNVYVHENQSYLGRLVIWCNRDDAVDLTDVTNDERDEFFLIIKDMKDALEKTFKPEILNYAFLANNTRHLHCHLVPRYSTDQKFEEITFKDERWGHNYKTNHNFVTPDEIRVKIKDRIKNALSD